MGRCDHWRESLDWGTRKSGTALIRNVLGKAFWGFYAGVGKVSRGLGDRAATNKNP